MGIRWHWYGHNGKERKSFPNWIATRFMLKLKGMPYWPIRLICWSPWLSFIEITTPILGVRNLIPLVECCQLHTIWELRRRCWKTRNSRTFMTNTKHQIHHEVNKYGFANLEKTPIEVGASWCCLGLIRFVISCKGARQISDGWCRNTSVLLCS